MAAQALKKKWTSSFEKDLNAMRGALVNRPLREKNWRWDPRFEKEILAILPLNGKGKYTPLLKIFDWLVVGTVFFIIVLFFILGSVHEYDLAKLIFSAGLLFGFFMYFSGLLIKTWILREDGIQQGAFLFMFYPVRTGGGRSSSASRTLVCVNPEDPSFLRVYIPCSRTILREGQDRNGLFVVMSGGWPATEIKLYVSREKLEKLLVFIP